MDFVELKAKANQLKTALQKNACTLLQVFAKAREDYKKSDSIESFVKTFLNEELMQKPERIPATAISVWILILLVFHWKFWIVFVFGILPIILYYLIRAIKKAPTADY